MVKTKANEYRDLLETWVKWWNGPGRENYHHPVIPPLKATGEALTCTICAGVQEEGRCQACGRDLH